MNSIKQAMSAGKTDLAEPFLSIVTPFHNTEKYLSECIESVLGQSYSNFEYILLNNCSTDHSRGIAEGYAKRDTRIRLLDNPKLLNQVQNYNEALRHISGASVYCKMIQADDRLYPDCLRDMVRLAEQDPAIGLVGAYTQLGDGVYLYGLPVEKNIFFGQEVVRAFFHNRLYVFGSPTTSLLRSDIVRKKTSFYSEVSPVEDAEVCFEILQSYKFGYIHQVLTFSRRDNVSTMTGVRSFGPMAITEMIAIHKFGPLFLECDEYGKCLKTIENRYYSFLAEGVLRGKGKAFWHYHQQGLGTICKKIDVVKLGVCCIGVLLDLALNPKSTIERLLNKI
jgi:glycosyltransferase involved in cell wall biosynthesis